jgi:hypothetical protein
MFNILIHFIRMQSFSLRVKKLIEDKGLREVMGINARNWSLRYGWEAATSQLRNKQYRLAIELCKAKDHESRGRPHVATIENALIARYGVSSGSRL